MRNKRRMNPSRPQPRTSNENNAYVDVSREPLSKDIFGKVTALPETPHPHWVWIYDMAAAIPCRTDAPICTTVTQPDCLEC